MAGGRKEKARYNCIALEHDFYQVIRSNISEIFANIVATQYFSYGAFFVWGIYKCFFNFGNVFFIKKIAENFYFFNNAFFYMKVHFNSAAGGFNTLFKTVIGGVSVVPFMGSIFFIPYFFNCF